MTRGQTNRVIAQLRRLAVLQERGGLTDAQLLERFLAQGEEIAFEELMRRHGPMVLGVCRRVLGESHDAADAFQATFLVLIRRAASIVPRSRVGPWLYGVARRTALKARASTARRRLAEQMAARDRPLTTPATDLTGDLRPLVDEELSRLPAKYRDPLVLCLLEAKSRKEAAGLLGWSEGTLSGRLARAKKLLGERLRRRGVALGGVALLAALTESAVVAAVPASLAVATMKAAVTLTGQTAIHAISLPVVALTEEVMKAMLVSKLKVVVGVLVLVAGIGLGAGAVSRQYDSAAQGTAPADGHADVKGVAAPTKKGETKPRDYVIEPPDILLVKYAPEGEDEPVKIAGERPVRPDGTIRLGQLGSVPVTGRTAEEARRAIAEHLARRLDGFDSKKLTVNVVAYRSKFIYVIADDAKTGDRLYRLPATGRESILDVLGGFKEILIGIDQKRVYVERLSGDGKSSQVLRVDWEAIARGGNAATNYILQPGDRVHIKSLTPKKADGVSRPDAVDAAGSDLTRELQAVLKALRAARSQEEQQRVVEDLDVLTKKLREQLKKPEGGSHP